MLKTTGSGLPPGPGGLVGAAEGVSYLVRAQSYLPAIVGALLLSIVNMTHCLSRHLSVRGGGASCTYCCETQETVDALYDMEF